MVSCNMDLLIHRDNILTVIIIRKLLQSLLSIAFKNPISHGFMIWLRSYIIKLQLKTKSYIYKWRKYDVPQDYIRSVEDYTADNGFYFEVVRNQEAFVMNEPKTLVDEVSEVFSNYQTLQLKPQFIAMIPEGRVFEQGYVLSHDNRLLEELSMHQSMSGTSYIPVDKTHDIFSTDIAIKPAEYIDGRVLVLATPFAQGNYYHWMMELIPRIEILQASNNALYDTIDFFYINSSRTEYQKETLRALGIPSEKIIDEHWHPHVCARELFVTSRTRNGMDCFFRPESVHFIRDLFKENICKEKTRRIYLNRKNVMYRKILNEDQLEALLYKYGIESVTLDLMSVSKQVELLSSCEMVVSPHGASLTNLVFCNEGAKVLELFHADNMNLMYWGLSNILKLDYRYMRTKEPKSQPSLDDQVSNFSDIAFDLEDVDKMVADMINDLG
jgi:capsular polysaccharide biosynthesis protein